MKFSDFTKAQQNVIRQLIDHSMTLREIGEVAKTDDPAGVIAAIRKGG